MKLKLPIDIQLKRKYNDINAEKFPQDWIDSEKNRRERIIEMNNDLHVELMKFSTYDIDINEIIDVGLRYALSKREFRNAMAQIIEEKKRLRLISIGSQIFK